MIAVWSTGKITRGENVPQSVEIMPFRSDPPMGCPSIYVSRDDDGFSFPATLFNGEEYFDLAFPASDRNVKEFLQSVADWSDFPFWVVHRDTPQTRWMRRLKESLIGHLGKSILHLMERQAITIKVV